MDKELADKINRHIEAEDKTYPEIMARLDRAQDAIDALRADLRDTRGEQREQRALVEPFAEFLADMQAVGRLGRTVRAVIGWLALVVGWLWWIVVY